jgi:hypothetical protein
VCFDEGKATINSLPTLLVEEQSRHATKQARRQLPLRRRKWTLRVLLRQRRGAVANVEGEEGRGGGEGRELHFLVPSSSSSAAAATAGGRLEEVDGGEEKRAGGEGREGCGCPASARRPDAARHSLALYSFFLFSRRPPSPSPSPAAHRKSGTSEGARSRGAASQASALDPSSSP